MLKGDFRVVNDLIQTKFTQFLLKEIEMTPELYDLPGQIFVTEFVSLPITLAKAGKTKQKLKQVDKEKAEKAKESIDKILARINKGGNDVDKLKKFGEFIKWYKNEGLKRGLNVETINKNVNAIRDYVLNNADKFKWYNPNILIKKPVTNIKEPTIGKAVKEIVDKSKGELIQIASQGKIATGKVISGIFAGTGLYEKYSQKLEEEKIIDIQKQKLIEGNQEESLLGVEEKFKPFASEKTGFEGLTPSGNQFKKVSGVEGKYKDLGDIQSGRLGSGTKGLERTKSNLKEGELLRSNLGLSPKQKNQLKNRLREQQKGRTGLIEASALISKQALKERQAQKLKTLQRTALKQRQPQIPKRPVGLRKIVRPIGYAGFVLPSSKDLIKKLEKRLLLKPKPSSYVVEAKEKGKWVRLSKKPLSKNDALSRGAYAVDNTTANTFRLKPVAKAKKLGKIREKNYYNRTRLKYRDYRYRKGKKIPLKNTFIERRGVPRIDTFGEKKELSLARLIKQKGWLKKRK